MEAVMMNSTGNNKHRFVNPTWNYATNRSLFPYPSDNLLLASYLSGSHFMSMPPVVSGFRPPHNLHHHRQQPPLLPLPNLTPINYRNTNITRSYSSPNNNNNNNNNNRINKNVKNRGRDHSLTPKKSKNQKKEVRVPVPPATAEEKQPPPPPENCSPESDISDIIGSDPKELDLPKDVVIPRVSFDDVDEFSGSAVFSPSPPPSSLPLPTFTLRPKASCKAQASAVASGVDAGATDGLRRLLRI